MVDLITSPWTSTFESIVRKSRESIVICSPYIGEHPCKLITELISESVRPNISVLLLTNLSCENMLSRATDVRGLIRLCEVIPHTDVRFLPNVHAKVYVSDDQAIVTSANMTRSGLARNLEYGVSISDAEIVDRIRDDIRKFHSIGTAVDLMQLRLFGEIVDELSALQTESEREAKSDLRRRFGNKLREADEEVLRVRAASMSSHAGFSETILFVLSSQGPCDTKGLYEKIRSIHPDLCDDKIKLVIRREEWSQAKWKHRVRHAQQSLSRQGKIIRDGDVWRVNT